MILRWIVLCGLLLALVGCDDVPEVPDEISESTECADDEVFDPDWGCEPFVIDDHDAAWLDQCEADLISCIDDELLTWNESPADCYDDEVYDAELEMCMLADDADFEALPDDQTMFEPWDETAADEADFGAVLVTYVVEGDRLEDPDLASDIEADYLDFQADTAAQQAVWRYFATLIPAEQRPMVTRFAFFSDGPDETLAWASLTDHSDDEWIIAVDLADTANQTDLTATLIHEIGHVLTLNSDQGSYDVDAVEACDWYVSDATWCASETSYLNSFTDRFWYDLLPEWEAVYYLEAEDERADAEYEFYETYADEFVSEYAATHPDEDIAESWTLFVLEPKPTDDTIRSQKILFFYEYPELIDLREQILMRAGSRLRR